MARFELQFADEHEEDGGGTESESENESVSQRLVGGSGGQGQAFWTLAAAVRRALVMCSAGAASAVDGDAGDAAELGMDIGWPTDVRHVAHVTFDRFDGFHGVPAELQPDVPPRVPSASTSVFGVSSKSMQCSYDNRGNSVPTILLLMQRHLYLHGGLEVEGIFRINAENGQEIHVRDQLSRGIVPLGIDMHCLAGLIKAWFRELPTGVLDSITPNQMMHCNTEDECSILLKMLPPVEAALLDWAINLMADVVEQERHNKMNARNIAMVFAPNMTQMADPLTALIHAVQVMNFLKTLITKTLQEREEAAEASFFQFSESTCDKDELHFTKSTEKSSEHAGEKTIHFNVFDRAALGKFLCSTEHSFGSDLGESFQSFGNKYDADDYDYVSVKSSPANNAVDVLEDGSSGGYRTNRDVEGYVSKDGCRTNRDVEGNVGGIMDKLNFGVRRICKHPMFQLNKSIKKLNGAGIGSPGREGREACVCEAR